MDQKAIRGILAQEGYSSESTFLEDAALCIALMKVEQYRAECEFFEKKYEMTIEEFRNLLHDKKGAEDFAQEEDLEDWEFASSALEWWDERIKEIQSASVS